MLRLLDKTEFDTVYEIMEKSFPKEEIRSYEGQQALLKRQEYRLYGDEDPTGNIIGFLAVWELPGILFIEHFAVEPEARNCGLGSRLLKELQERYALPMCLEVELPTDELTKRRIGFYERNGFSFNPYPYEQPSLGEGRDPVPLRLMTTGGRFRKEAFLKVKELLYAVVYEC